MTPSVTHRFVGQEQGQTLGSPLVSAVFTSIFSGTKVTNRSLWHHHNTLFFLCSHNDFPSGRKPSQRALQLEWEGSQVAVLAGWGTWNFWTLGMQWRRVESSWLAGSFDPSHAWELKFKNSFPIFRQDLELFSLAGTWSVWHPSFPQQLSLLPLGALLCRNVINLSSAWTG